jgi:hypothetical protein
MGLGVPRSREITPGRAMTKAMDRWIEDLAPDGTVALGQAIDDVGPDVGLAPVPERLSRSSWNFEAAIL